MDAEILRDPYPVLAELREHAPVFWHTGMDSWALTRYADSVRVLRDHETFARDPRRTGGKVPEPSLSVQTLDPPQQSRVRSLFMTALRAQDLTGVEDRARLLVRERLDQLAGGARSMWWPRSRCRCPWRLSRICWVSSLRRAGSSPRCRTRSCGAWTAASTPRSSNRAASPANS
ncbi:hypothetical protein [Streptomyces atratus]|uniref:hypothetical protein n=1 Tax=Streptomyces atratus TaxID=1893 RepID=UPI00365500F0